MKLSKTEATLSAAALKAGMTEKTARKWRQRGHQPSEEKTSRTYRTRADPFAEVWGELETFLLCDASVEALTLFEYLSRTYPDQFQANQVRTLQRRLKLWRLEHGAEREVYFPQLHVPGRQGQSDFTYMKEVQVTIAGQPFAHLLYHFTLTYSNWEWGMICATESYESLAQGLQQALWELGGVPVEHRTDSLAAAVTPRQTKAEFTEKYQGLLRHYGLQASHTNPGCGHENGDVEQSHHRFKQAVKQELLLRGSRDFASRSAYEEFLRQLFQRRNHLRRERVAADVAALRALPEKRLDAFTVERHRVTKASTIQVRSNFYSVPSQWIGEWVEVRVYGEQLEVWLGGKCLQRMTRLRGQGQAHINYRHVIHSLVRKPGAFQHYLYQPSLFPRLVFRLAWEALQAQHPTTRTNEAEREYLKLLYLAAQESEELVAQVLEEMLAQEQAVTSQAVHAQMVARRGVVQRAGRLAALVGIERLRWLTQRGDAMSNKALQEQLRHLHLPGFVGAYAGQSQIAAQESWTYEQYLSSLCALELGQREVRRKEKLLAASRLPREKTLANFERQRLKRPVERQFAALLSGEFLARAENVLVFGNPGGGKTHLLCALGHELVQQGHSVSFSSCVLLVQRLLTAKRELWLEKELKRLDKAAALIIDDLGYVQQSREEMEVLFTLLAHRYERGSVLLTSNLVFSQWEQIFKDPMTTAAAIDRLVHHSVILEMNLPSYRMAAAQQRKTTPTQTE